MADVQTRPPSMTSCADRADEGVRIAGARGSRLVVTLRGLTVCHCATVHLTHVPCRTWDLQAVATLGVRDYGRLGAVVATLESGTALPLLLLDPEQVPAARRAVDLVAAPLARASIMRRSMRRSA